MSHRQLSAQQVATTLTTGLQDLVKVLENAPFYKGMTAPRVDPRLISATLKHVYLSIYQYQPHVTEATFTAVGRMPKQSEQLIKSMILQQVEEVEHADMAMRDYLRLGGDKPQAEGPMFPECAAVAAVCHYLGEHCHPASYLGFMYLFEALTPIMAARAQAAMDGSGYQKEAREFIDIHATEDIRHTDVVVGVMQELIKIDPTAAEAILFGYHTFAAVYPLPVWAAAHERALREIATT